LIHTVAALVIFSQIIDVGMAEEFKSAFLLNVENETFFLSSHSIGLNIKDFENPGNSLKFNVANYDDDIEKYNKRFISKCRSIKL